MVNDILIAAESLKAILPVYKNHILEQAKSHDSTKIAEPLKDDTPSVYITGIIPDSKDYVAGELEYISKTEKFHAYTYIKLQGTSSLAHPKKNYTINLYSDERRNQKLNKEFKNWGFHNNYVLKADYIDILHARNVVCAKLWSKIVQSRPDYESLPEELRNSPNNGAIDGFPVKVYVNGEYHGLYNWTIPKCDWQFGMNADNEKHAVLCAEFNDNGDDARAENPCNFNVLWDGADGEYWSVEVGTNSDALTSSMNAVIQAIIDDDTITLGQVLDVQSAIDYCLFQEIILGIDGLAKNMLLATYDMTKWHLSAYDMDSTFDLHWEGSLMGASTAGFGCAPYLNTQSWLWPLIWDNYWDAFCDRYVELRKSVLSHASIMTMFEEYVGIYGEDVYIKDTVSYPDIPSATVNTLAYLNNFVNERLAYLDDLYEVVV